MLLLFGQFIIIIIIQRSHALTAAAAAAPPGRRRLSGVLFDCDGVLADTEPDGHRVAFNAAFEEKGFAAADDVLWDVDLYGELLETGGGKERMTAFWNKVGWPEGYDTEDSRSVLVRELHARKTQLFNEMISNGDIPLRPGVLRVIDEALAEGVPVAVCSTSSEQAVSNLVRVLMGDERADKIRIFAGDVVAKKKPAPDVYLLAAETMDLDSGACVVVEDSSIGLRAAKAAGMWCIITKSSYAHREDFGIADKVVDDLGEITLDTIKSIII
ncbi:hypothetical protein CTAYLR_009794 [Chrysophaeum taylorii]|uniref:Uncharacterized protein n=1 Tax=Chrysophaeum taylorii TaxID=2483200 RepID=A0AAD7UMD9_9STRA|nr:hypothetical protein CTAYLR_009794 [Chrysophaeum taylorii]